jgi:hypothetical protein
LGHEKKYAKLEVDSTWSHKQHHIAGLHCNYLSPFKAFGTKYTAQLFCTLEFKDTPSLSPLNSYASINDTFAMLMLEMLQHKTLEKAIKIVELLVTYSLTFNEILYGWSLTKHIYSR